MNYAEAYLANRGLGKEPAPPLEPWPFAEGQEVVLLLAPRADGSPGLLGMAQGFIEVIDDDGVAIARRHPMGPGLADHAGGIEYYPLEALLHRLRTP